MGTERQTKTDIQNISAEDDTQDPIDTEAEQYFPSIESLRVAASFIASDDHINVDDESLETIIVTVQMEVDARTLPLESYIDQRILAFQAAHYNAQVRYENDESEEKEFELTVATLMLEAEQMLAILIDEWEYRHPKDNEDFTITDEDMAAFFKQQDPNFGKDNDGKD